MTPRILTFKNILTYGLQLFFFTIKIHDEETYFNFRFSFFIILKKLAKEFLEILTYSVILTCIEIFHSHGLTYRVPLPNLNAHLLYFHDAFMLLISSPSKER